MEKKNFPLTVGSGVSNHSLKPACNSSVAGFSLVELMITIALVAILAAVAVPSYKSYTEKTKITKTIVMLSSIAMAIEDYRLTNNVYPSNLNQIDYGGRLDPWGTVYQYLWIDGNPDPSIGASRRRNQWNNPVNTNFDLFSNGPDLKSQTQFTAIQARDDIVWAYDGTYIGSVSDL